MTLTAEVKRRWAPAPLFYVVDDYVLMAEGRR
jgi:hypothetical protein